MLSNPPGACLSNSNLTDNYVSNVYVGDDGKLHLVKGGADSALPFSKGGIYIPELTLYSLGQYGAQGYQGSNGGLTVKNSIQFDVTNYTTLSIQDCSSGFSVILNDGSSDTTISISAGGVYDITNYMTLYFKNNFSNYGYKILWCYFNIFKNV